MKLTLAEIMEPSEPLVRQRSTYALLWMRHVLRTEGTTCEHKARLRMINNELRRREAS